MSYNVGMEVNKIKYELPERFFADHVERDLLDTTELDIQRKKNKVIVELTDAQIEELLDDAEYYVECGVEELGRHYIGIVSSATATVDAIKKQRK